MHLILSFVRSFFLWCAFRRTSLGLLIFGLFLTVSTPACSSTLPRERPVNTCDTTGGKSGAPYCLPPPGFFCERNPLQPANTRSGRGHKAYLGQFQLFPSKQGLGINQPTCPQNATRLLQNQDWNDARDGAEKIGKQVGRIFATCEKLMEAVTRPSDLELQGIYDENPGALEKVFNMCAKELDAIPVMPAYDDPWLAGAALRGFEAGYGAGADEVWLRLLALDLAIAVVESAIVPGVLFAEVVITRGIRLSLSVVRRMPIFLPGTVGAGGAFLKGVPRAAAKAVVTGSSRVLGDNMKRVGLERLAGEFAHHIVAHGDDRAKLTVEILEKFHIDVDDAVNGVYLPGYKTSPNPHGKVVHGNLHTNDYYQAVHRVLEGATTQAEVIQRLRFIAYNLEHGILP